MYACDRVCVGERKRGTMSMTKWIKGMKRVFERKRKYESEIQRE